MNNISLLSDAKIAKNDLEYVLNVDSPGQPPECSGRKTQLLRNKFLIR